MKPIADAISKGKITAKALVRLVGEEMVLTHSGKDREFKSEEEIAKAIDLVAVATVSKSNEMSEDKFLGRYEKRSVIEETIRKNLLEFKEGAERDFFISLMPRRDPAAAQTSKRRIPPDSISRCRLRRPLWMPRRGLRQTLSKRR